MVAMYTIAGRQVGSHVLAMAVLGTTFAGGYLALRGDGKKKEAGPPINAKSNEEEAFIKQFIESANSSGPKEKKK